MGVHAQEPRARSVSRPVRNETPPLSRSRRLGCVTRFAATGAHLAGNVSCILLLLGTAVMTAAAHSTEAAPWRLFAAHEHAPFAFFIDRADSRRPSFAGSRPRAQLVVDADGGARVWKRGAWHRTSGDPLDAIETFVEESRALPAAVPAWLAAHTLPRTVGYLAYELGRFADGCAARATCVAGETGLPLAVLSTYDEVDAWDGATRRSARVRFQPTGAAGPPALAAPDAAGWSATSRQRYRGGFTRVREAIGAGDIYQANLSRRDVFALDVSPAAAYARLRAVQPVPWGAFLDFGGFALLSNSPECFLVRDGTSLLTQPIKGTRPRRADAREDAALAYDLRTDAKETAEHLMIVDLERNDLGRVARTGSVDVPRYAEVESFATLHHLVSDVVAEARDGIGLAALLRATFPGGSITGAPKIRAMEILAEVEETPRGPYTGAIGFFNGAERLELSIAIRTAVAAGRRLLCQAGGGIVADSDADREWNETELKLAALRRALEQSSAAGADPANGNDAAPQPRKASVPL
jgi:para-aminobenzoate synthetase component 1